MNPKTLLNALVDRLGYQIVAAPRRRHGRKALFDVERLLGGAPDALLFFDIGANVGQTVLEFRKHFPSAVIHSFEPLPSAYRELRALADQTPDVHAWNFGFGSACTTATINVNTHSPMSSLLELGPAGWGSVQSQTTVSIRTVDDFCEEHNIARIDLLKTDTQGFDLEVLRGAERVLPDVGLVLTELNFAEIYRDQPPWTAICQYLVDRDFALVNFYEMKFAGLVGSWANALFANRRLHCSPA